MDRPGGIEPLQHRRIRLHTLAVGLGALGGVAATLYQGYWGGLLIGLVAGFLSAPLIECWLMAKRLSIAGPRATIACLAVCIGAGFLPHPLAILLAAAIGSLVAIEIAVSPLPDVWPPSPDTCDHCGYDLRGTTTDLCPECGRPRPHPCCTNCGYDLYGVPGDTCPECGRCESTAARAHDSAGTT